MQHDDREKIGKKMKNHSQFTQYLIFIGCKEANRNSQNAATLKPIKLEAVEEVKIPLIMILLCIKKISGEHKCLELHNLSR